MPGDTFGTKRAGRRRKGVAPAPAPAAPTLLTAPVAAADPRVGLAATGTAATFSGAASVAHALYIDGVKVADGLTYTPVAADAFKLIELRATATNAGGSTVASAFSGAIAPAPATFAMTQLAKANRIYQRTTASGGGQGKGTGTVPVAINVSSAGGIYARRRSASDGSSIVQAPWFVGTVAATGAQTLNVTGVDAPAFTSAASPAPVQANDGYFFLDLSGDGTNWTNGTTPIAMGRIIAASGQSLAVRLFRRLNDTATFASLSITPTPYGRVFATYADGTSYTPAIGTVAWELPADGGNYDSAFAAQFLRYQVAHAGVACGLIGHAVGATAIATWQPGQANNTQLRTVLAGAGGAFESFYWFQGHSDGFANTTSSAYKAGLDGVFGDMAAQSSRPFSKYVTSIPAINSTVWGSNAQIQIIRQAAAEWSAANGAVYVTPQDFDTVDGVHQGQAGAVTIAQHLDRAMRPELGLAGSDAGPTIASVQRTGGTITLGFNLPSGATALAQSGTANTRLALYEAGTTTLRWTVPALTVTTNAVSFADPYPEQAFDLLVDYINNVTGNTGSTNILRDNSIYADEATLGFALGRCVSPSLTPLAIAAGANVVRNMTMTSAAYQAAASGFGQELRAGWGNAANAPTPPNRTIECWVNIPANPASLGVIAHTGYEWIGCLTSGQLRVNLSNIGNVDIATPTIPGTRKHIAIAINQTSTFIFIDGTLINTRTNAAGTIGTTANGFTARALSGGSFILPTGNAVDELVLWTGCRYTTSFTPPAAPYVGNEAGMIALYHFDGSGADSCTL